jgi:L-rhamnose-H+ transport protein
MRNIGIGYALLSGLCNGLFTAPMKVIPKWRWENIWLVFIVTSCLIAPYTLVRTTVPDYPRVFAQASPVAVWCAVLFGFAWGFGAILFGRSVDRLGVSLANTLVIGVSAALGSFLPLLVGGKFRFEARQGVLFLGVLAFVGGVAICGSAGRKRDAARIGTAGGGGSWNGYLLAIGAGLMSAVFNIGYTLAMPIAESAERMGYSNFLGTNCIWLLMLAAGSIPNIVYCCLLAMRNNSFQLFVAQGTAGAWLLSILMGVLWSASIFLYGAAVPLLGDIGPSIGWPLSLAMGLLTANLMGLWLGEWRGVAPQAIRAMRLGVGLLLAAIVLCGVSTSAGS